MSHDRLLILGLSFICVGVPFCVYPVFLLHYSMIFPVFDLKVGSVSGCSPNGGAIMEDRSSRLLCCVEAAGGTSLIQAAAIGSCDVINTGKWHLPAQSRRRHRGRQADKLGGTVTASVALHLDDSRTQDWTHFFTFNPGGNQ